MEIGSLAGKEYWTAASSSSSGVALPRPAAIRVPAQS
jgi:hypothetical protein